MRNTLLFEGLQCGKGTPRSAAACECPAAGSLALKPVPTAVMGTSRRARKSPDDPMQAAAEIEHTFDLIDFRGAIRFALA